MKEPWLNSWQGQEMYRFSTASILALEPTHLPIKWVLGALSSGIKRPGHEGKNAFMAWTGTVLLLQRTSVSRGGHPVKIWIGNPQNTNFECYCYTNMLSERKNGSAQNWRKACVSAKEGCEWMDLQPSNKLFLGLQHIARKCGDGLTDKFNSFRTYNYIQSLSHYWQIYQRSETKVFQGCDAMFFNRHIWVHHMALQSWRSCSEYLWLWEPQNLKCYPRFTHLCTEAIAGALLLVKMESLLRISGRS